MNPLQKLDPSDYLGLKTLIVGEVNSGKTTLTKQILDAMAVTTSADRMAAIDLAPDMPQKVRDSSLSGVGGRLDVSEAPGILYLKTRIVPPRLSSKTEEEALDLAAQNEAAGRTLFEEFSKSGRDILYINDISLYLQAGRTEQLTVWLYEAGTVVANGYLGQKLGQGILSQRENKEMKALERYFDKVIRI